MASLCQNLVSILPFCCEGTGPVLATGFWLSCYMHLYPDPTEPWCLTKSLWNLFPSPSVLGLAQISVQKSGMSLPTFQGSALALHFHKMCWSGLPRWRSGWESPCQCRGHGFEPWSGRIPHATEQLGPWATTTELARLEPVLCNKRGRDSERPAHRDEEWPLLAATREGPRTETKTQHSQK